MTTFKHNSLAWAGTLTVLVAVTHLTCAVFGGDWYRVLGAGEQFAQMSEQGHWYPAVFTIMLACVFIVWSLYAFSGAGLIRRLPLVRIALCLISAVFLIRGLAFFVIVPLFPDNSLTFWVISSSICLVIGTLYSVGTFRAWKTLHFA